MFSYVFFALIALTLVSYFMGRRRAVAVVGGAEDALHSRPTYHGAFVAAWVGLPSFLLVLLWLLFQGPVIDAFLVGSLPPEKTLGLTPAQIDLLVAEIKSVAAGNIFGEPDASVTEAAERYNRWQEIAGWAMFAAAMAVALVGLAMTRARIAPEFRARHGVERVLNVIMIVCSTIAILTTLGIIISLLIEALRFFDRVSPIEFFFGLNWEPQIPIREDQVTAGGAFGAIPVFTGTILIASIAMRLSPGRRCAVTSTAMGFCQSA